MSTKLTLNYQIISGPYGNGWIKTKIDAKPEKLPFELMYLKENPKEVLKELVKKYIISEYKDLEMSKSLFKYKKHLLSYGLSIKEANLEGVTINNSVYKTANLSFLPKLNLTKEKLQGKVRDLILEHAITTYIEYGPIFQTPIGPKSHNIQVTENYFKNRKDKKNPEKEKQLKQILEYAQVVLYRPNFSIKDLEKMVDEKVFAV